MTRIFIELVTDGDRGAVLVKRAYTHKSEADCVQTSYMDLADAKHACESTADALDYAYPGVPQTRIGF